MGAERCFFKRALCAFLALLTFTTISLSEPNIQITGWRRLNKFWPLGTNIDYFATPADIGSSRIRIKLPKEVQTDLIVNLDYFYAFTDPNFPIIINIAPVSGNGPSLDSHQLQSNEWKRISWNVKRRDLSAENIIIVTVSMNAKNDMFLWKSLEVRSAQDSGERPKRDTSIQRIHERCTPDECNEALFVLENFSTFKRGVPDWPNINNEYASYHLTTKQDDPLKFELCCTEDPEKINFSFEIWVYLEENTSLELWLLDGQGSDRQLDVVKCPAGDPTSGQWRPIKHDLQAYIPNLVCPPDKSIQVRLVPKFGPNGLRKSAVVVNREELYNFRTLEEYLKEPSGVGEFYNFWRLSSDGIHEPLLESSEGEIHLRGIWPFAERVFHLTSGWIQSGFDVDAIEHPVKFVYSYHEAAWIESVTLQIQLASESTLPYKWTELIEDPIEHQLVGRILKQVTLNTSLLFNLAHDPSRIRVLHKIKQDVSGPLRLKIITLAFGDLCIETNPPFCFNEAICLNEGLAKAKCNCTEGFSGVHCEISENQCGSFQPNGLTGNQNCRDIGATCIEYQSAKPFYRCRYDDEICLSKESDAEQTRTINELEEAKRTSTKVIIALLVILILLFLSIINLLIRLIRRRKQSQTGENAFELARCNLKPSSTSNPNSLGANLRQQSISYNNKSFDQSI